MVAFVVDRSGRDLALALEVLGGFECAFWPRPETGTGLFSRFSMRTKDLIERASQLALVNDKQGRSVAASGKLGILAVQVSKACCSTH